MTKGLRIIAMTVLLFMGFLASEASALNQILNVRHWVAPDHTRIVIDTSEAPDYTVEKSKELIRIDFKNSVFPINLQGKMILNKPGVAVISMERLFEQAVRVEILLADHVDVTVFNLQKIGEKPDRVVIDIDLPETEKKEAEERKPVTRKNRIIVIDPGHGGDDPGAIGPRGTQEKDIVLKIGKRLRNRFNKQDGYRAFLTRDGDYYVSFSKRLKIAREYGADLFLSIHADATPNRQVSGASVYCLSIRGASTEAARLLAMKENLADMMGGSPNGESSEDSGPIVLNMYQTNTINTSKIYGQSVLEHISRVMPLKFSAVQSAPFKVLKLPEIPSLLVETAYISNKKEERLLRSRQYQNRIADAIVNAVMEILPAEPAAEPAPGVILAQQESGSPQKEVAEQKGDTDIKHVSRTEAPKIQETQVQYYTVKRGDTLAKIAKRHRTTLATLLRINRMELEDPLFADRKIKIAVLNKSSPALPAVPGAVDNSSKSGNTDSSEIKKSASDTCFYRVKRGDTLAKIAHKHGTTLNALLKMNNMKLEDPIYAKRMIKVKEGYEDKVKIAYYTVKRGDTLDKIANRHKTTLAELLELNQMKLRDTLVVGRKIKIVVMDENMPVAPVVSSAVEVSSQSQTKNTDSPDVPNTDAENYLYKVQRGDTLPKIAKKFGTTLNVLLKINKMKIKDTLLAGRMIKIKERPVEKETATAVEKDIPSQNKKRKFAYHRVKKGETLDIIARRNGTTIDELRQLNRMKPSDTLLTDQKLKLPQQSSL